MLSTEDLRFFVTLAASSSMAAAARSLNVTPPAVTQRLRQIEERLGLHLVDRSGRRMVLTGEGEHLATIGRRILDEVSTGILPEQEGSIVTIEDRNGQFSQPLRPQCKAVFSHRRNL